MVGHFRGALVKQLQQGVTPLRQALALTIIRKTREDKRERGPTALKTKI